MNKLRFFSAVIALIWLGVAFTLWAEVLAGTEMPTKIIALVAGVAFVLLGGKGASKVTAFFGKILIAMSVLALAAQLVYAAPELASYDTLLRTLALVSGLLLERISPHQQMYPWMFFMIATKVELVIIGAFLALVAEAQGVHVEQLWWWAVIPMMLLAALLLARRKRVLYRAVILFTAVYALFLALDIVLVQSPSHLVIVVAACAVVWPFITERLIGYRAFHPKLL